MNQSESVKTSAFKIPHKDDRGSETMRSMSTLDDSTKAILQFATSGDIDKFLNMPMDKKLSLANV